MKKQLFTGFLFVLSSVLFSQNLLKRNDTIAVFHQSHSLKLAWASGLNSGQLSHIDFNKDGLKDIFILEPNIEANSETGDKIYPFINLGGSGQTEYKFAPEYRSYFPILEEYVFLRDYNCDGKEDIFTRDIRQRMTVYKNTTQTDISFELEKRILKTDTSQIPYNPSYFHYGEIFWSYPDMPSITDVDGDGDLDILSAAINPHFIEYNKNLSLEKYGVCDSLDFEVKSTCWGRFLEDTGTVTLNMCDIVNVPNPEFTSNKKGYQQQNNKTRHSQDAMLALDLDGDGDMDLLEGDAGRPYLYSFINGGRKDSAHMVSFTEAFPAVDTFNAKNYAQPFNLDVNNDGRKDLVISVYTDRLQDTASVWYYENSGTGSAPNFVLKTKSFLQEEMIDVGTQSKPVFFNYNQDSLMDLIIGNYGYFQDLGTNWYQSIYKSQLALYKNTGSKKQPVFTLVDDNFGDLPSYPLNVNGNKPSFAYHPTFGDLDNDGDEDMIIGDARGKIHYFENIPIAGEADFQLSVAELPGIDVGDYSTPQLFDLNEDGKLDLIIGEADGNLNYYKNNSTSVISFILEDDSLGDINVRDVWDWVGYSAPFMFKDSVGTTKLICGSKPGFLHFYDSIVVGGVISAQFHLLEKRFQDIWDGIYSTTHAADIDADSALDFVFGNQSGGLTLYTSLDSIYKPDGIWQKTKINYNTVLYPNPASGEIHIKIQCECSDIFTFAIYDQMGRLTDQIKGSSHLILDVSDYPPGLYMVKAENKNRSIVITERFVKSP